MPRDTQDKGGSQSPAPQRALATPHQLLSYAMHSTELLPIGRWGLSDIIPSLQPVCCSGHSHSEPPSLTLSRLAALPHHSYSGLSMLLQPGFSSYRANHTS